MLASEISSSPRKKKMFLRAVHKETRFLLCAVVVFVQPWILTTTTASRIGDFHLDFVDPSANISLDDHDNHQEVISCSSPSEGGDCSRSPSSAAEININERYDSIENQWTPGNNHSKCYSNSSVGYHCYCDEGYTSDPYNPQGCHGTYL